MVLAGGAVMPGVGQDAIKPSQATVSSNRTAVTAPPPAPPAQTSNAGAQSRSSPIHASPWVDEVERLTKAGIDEGVILSYVNNSAGTFNLTADQVARLKDTGTSPQVLNAMIQHDAELVSGARPLTASSPPSLPTAFRTVLTTNRQPAIATATPAGPPAPVQIVANDDYDADRDLIYVEPDDVPDQPPNLGPVRVPYPVKLNDPIVILRLPSFSVPCW